MSRPVPLALAIAALFAVGPVPALEPQPPYDPLLQPGGELCGPRQGPYAEAQKAFRDSLARVRNNGWALAGLAETYRRSGERKSEQAARQALKRAWLGPAAGPDVARL